MPRLPLDTPLDDELRDLFAAAINNRQPPLNTIAVNAVLATRAGFSVAQIDAIVQGQDALAAGYSDTDLAEAFVSIQLASFVDHFTNYAQTPFDVPTAAEAA